MFSWHKSTFCQDYNKFSANLSDATACVQLIARNRGYNNNLLQLCQLVTSRVLTSIVAWVKIAAAVDSKTMSLASVTSRVKRTTTAALTILLALVRLLKFSWSNIHFILLSVIRDVYCRMLFKILYLTK